MRNVGLEAPRDDPLLLYATDTPRATIAPLAAPPVAVLRLELDLPAEAVLASPTTFPLESRRPTRVPRESKTLRSLARR